MIIIFFCSGFLPTVMVFLSRIPFIGWFFQQPFFLSVSHSVIYFISVKILSVIEYKVELCTALLELKMLNMHFVYLQFFDRFRQRRVPVWCWTELCKGFENRKTYLSTLELRSLYALDTFQWTQNCSVMHDPTAGNMLNVHW